MKKKIGLMLCMALVILCAVASADVKINEKHFPDAAFREYVKQFDKNKDNYLSETEISKVTEIDVSSKQISNLMGIEYFTSIWKLDCSKNQLKDLDISHNTKLWDLRCQNNRLTSLDLSKNSRLACIWCFYNQLTELDIRNCEDILIVCAYRNQLRNVKIGKKDKLYWYDVSYSYALQSVDISQCKLLVNLVNTCNPRYGCYKYWCIDNNGDGSYEYFLAVAQDTRVISVPEKISVTTIKLEKTKVSLKKGKSITMSVKEILPGNATNKKVRWSSSDKSIATVSSKGKVKAKKKGTCYITCMATDGSGVPATCKITVK